MLECADHSIYTGMNNNMDRRLKEHQFGRDKNSYTYSRRPVKLIFHQEFLDVNQAIYFEKKIKKWSRKKKLALATGDFDMLQILAECRNATHYKYKPGFDCAQPDIGFDCDQPDNVTLSKNLDVLSSAVEKPAEPIKNHHKMKENKSRLLPSQELTRAEEEIMQLLWQLKEANVAQIIEEMPTPKPAYNTVSTIVRILENKGFVDYKKMGRSHIYFPLVKKETYTKNSMNKLMNNYFNGSVKSMLSFFVKKNEMSVKELEDILSEIDKNEEK